MVLSSQIAASQDRDLTLDTYFQPLFVADEFPNVIFLSGEIDVSHALAFTRAMREQQRFDTLLLDSVGGEVRAALIIAEAVNEHRMSTVIVEDGICFSACSYIYLAGHDRIPNGRLGVHQFSGGSENSSIAQMSVADILATLGQFETHPEVVQRMLRTPPDDMYIFSTDEIERFELAGKRSGIAMVQEQNSPDLSGDANVTSYSEQSPPRNNSYGVLDVVPEPDYSIPTPQDAAGFVIGLINSGSTATSASIDRETRRNFADYVQYYGETKSLDEVVIDKRNYTQRWERREYRVVPQSMQSFCNQQGCQVRGELDWKVESSSRDRVLAGRSSFAYRLTSRMPFKVLEEQGAIIRRY